MNAVAAAPRARWVPAAWLALVAGWICLLVPGMPLARTIGLVLVAVAIVLALMAIVRGGMRAGLAPLLAALLVSPLVYFGAGMWRGGPVEGAGDASTRALGTSPSMTGPATARPAPVVTAPPAPRPDIAMRTTVTAVEFSGAYVDGAAAGDKQFKGQRLLLAGMVDRLDPDAAGGPVVTFNAGELAPVQALGLARDTAASLRVGQQVILACDGAAAVGGKPTVEHCKLAQ
ncbi:hypothetical protein [Cognatilysobacter segetis]|uniref:hypothetical protein n=1 Tax=Cognatilysobacter segetis TaxID=2492394 RepID=UPI0010603C88|nr:hypothetical protein [Lysobacter segetis]